MLRDFLWLCGRYLALALSVVLVNFFLPRLLPGDPLDFSSGDGLDAAVPLTASARAELEAYYHLDDPILSQLWSYLGDLVTGDLGFSISRSAPVGDLILDRLPWTMSLLLVSLLLSAAIGTALGMVAGWRPGKRRDRVLMSASGMLAAIPEFLIAIGLLLGGAVGLAWFPLFGGETVFTDWGGGPSSFVRRAFDIAWHLTLPAATLALAGVAAFALVTRDVTAGLQHEPWLVAARAKGLDERQIAVRHALPNMAPPLVTFFGLRLGGVLSGALVVERVFSIPGLGQLGFQAIGARDYPVLQALFLLSSLGVLLVAFLVELSYPRLDPGRRSDR
ncbi:MAG: ABC transporter permease [Chloroflexia bacterium]|nr:ABC transporter permease [Chloroflexia bacterium]